MVEKTRRPTDAGFVTMKNAAFYLLAIALLLSLQYWKSRDLISGPPPLSDKATLTGIPAQQQLAQGTRWIYVWAEWCAICTAMQDNVDAVLREYPGLTIATRSGNDTSLIDYLHQHRLNWPTLNDHDGSLQQRLGLHGVPAIFFLNTNGDIVWSSIGYSSEWGLRTRLWLVEYIPNVFNRSQ